MISFALGMVSKQSTAINNYVGPNQTMLTKVFFDGATLQQVASSCTVSPLQAP